MELSAVLTHSVPLKQVAWAPNVSTTLLEG